MSDVKITEDWLRECGFKWHQFDRQPDVGRDCEVARMCEVTKGFKWQDL